MAEERNMKYYVVEVIQYNDGQKDSPAIYSYDDVNKAIARFHKDLGAWMVKPEVKHMLVMVVNDEGGVYKNETYTAPVIEEAEPETPVEE